MTPKSDQTTGYLNLTNEALTTVLEAQSAWTARLLRYAKASFDVVAKPYGLATTPAACVSENMERANSLIELSKEEMRATGNAAVQLGDKLIDHANTWQETAAEGAEELQKTLVSNLDALKERTEQHVDRFSKPHAASTNGATGSTAHARQRPASARRKNSRKS
ncbi:MAG: hypothetical protein M3160_00570 [Candidatus Eremiobacteraeota bacterium]|nr:hypothetical protein [Candidatus Eremiobacteraeota bacterium]